MNVELQINNSISPTARFVSWAPSPCRIRVTDPSGATAPLVNVQITGASAATAGAVVFRGEHNWTVLQQPDSAGPNHWRLRSVFRRRRVRATQRQQRRRENRSPHRNHAGRLGSGDGAHPKERQHADAGRTRPLRGGVRAAQQPGTGRFADFRDMHTAVSSSAGPRRDRGFCPGTALTCSISNVSFRRSIRASHCLTGASTSPRRTSSHASSSASPIALGTVQFSATNPLQFWTTDGVQGINRRPFFNTACSAAWPPHRGADAGPRQPVPGVPDHGRQPARISAHQLRRFHLAASRPPREIRCSSCFTATSIDSGRSGSGRTAASIRRRRPRTTAVPGTRSATTCPTRCGRGTGSPEAPRPPTAPGGAMAASPSVSAPGPQPRVRDCLDYQGSVNAVSRMGFDYDDVPFA